MKRELVRGVRKAIKDSRKSQNAFAREIGLSPAHLCKVLKGDSRIGWKAALKLESATGINAREFVSVGE